MINGTKYYSKKKLNNSIKKYSFINNCIYFGLIFVSVVKNETRNLEKEINNLRATINEIKFNLYQTVLDHEVITSPENISKLAEKTFRFRAFKSIKKISNSKPYNENIRNYQKHSKQKNKNI